jgi:hypothetical protein
MAKVMKESDNSSYLVEFDNGMKLWFDVWYEAGELTGDWNKYIFSTNDEEDMKIKAFQDAHNDEAGAYNYMDALSAIDSHIVERENSIITKANKS